MAGLENTLNCNEIMDLLGRRIRLLGRVDASSYCSTMPVPKLLSDPNVFK